MSLLKRVYFEDLLRCLMASSPFLTDSNGGIGFSTTDMLTGFFFNFCLPIILFIFLLKIYHDNRKRKKRLENMFQITDDTMILEE